MHPAAGAVCALVGLLSALPGPWLLARLPEPEPAEDDGDFPPKVPYAALAAAPRLGLRLAVVSGVAAGGLGLALGWTWWLVLGVALCALGVLLAYVDLRTWLLPSRLIAPAYVVAAALVLASPLADGTTGGVLRAAVGWAAARGVMWGLWRFGAGLGYGDVRLGGLLGLVLGALGWGPWAVGLWSGFALGAVGWWPLRRLGLTSDRRLPFGPFLIAGAWLGAVVGESVWAALTGG